MKCLLKQRLVHRRLRCLRPPLWHPYSRRQAHRCCPQASFHQDRFPRSKSQIWLVSHVLTFPPHHQHQRPIRRHLPLLPLPQQIQQHRSQRLLSVLPYLPHLLHLPRLPRLPRLSKRSQANLILFSQSEFSLLG
jgi:hypothetical protein